MIPARSHKTGSAQIHENFWIERLRPMPHIGVGKGKFLIFPDRRGNRNGVFHFGTPIAQSRCCKTVLRSCF